jgi:hypothetical protein
MTNQDSQQNITTVPPTKIIPAFKQGDYKQFMRTVEALAQMPTPTPSTSDFRFDFTMEAATHNSKLIQNQTKLTILSMGSELRPIEQLDSLLSHHPNYKQFRHNTINGIDYPAPDLDEDTRITDLMEQIQRGNHKSALEPEALEHVSKAMKSDVQLGYGIPLTIDCIKRLKHAEVYPIGLQHQQTINEQGEIIPKKRISHDLSNRKDLKRSINQRTNIDLIPDVLYGYVLLRFLHLIHHIRWSFPSRKILMNKVDIEKAYRRFHTTPKVASKCIAIWPTDDNKDIAVLLTRLPFGLTPAPAHFSIGSDITCA